MYHESVFSKLCTRVESSSMSNEERKPIYSSNIVTIIVAKTDDNFLPQHLNKQRKSLFSNTSIDSDSRLNKFNFPSYTISENFVGVHLNVKYILGIKGCLDQLNQILSLYEFCGSKDLCFLYTLSGYLIRNILDLISHKTAIACSQKPRQMVFTFVKKISPRIPYINSFESVDNIDTNHSSIYLGDSPGIEKYLSVGTFSDKYNLCEMLGQGSFCNVYRCVNKLSGESYALKICQTESSIEAFLLKQEIKILRKLTNTDTGDTSMSIIKLLDSYCEPEYGICGVIELANDGDLFTLLEKGGISEKKAALYFHQLCGAVDYIHRRWIIHRDIKPENVMLTRIGESNTPIIKLTDFGMAIQLTPDGKMRNQLFRVCGTCNYMAPEIIKGTGYSLPVDLWACGVLLYELLVGRPPFESLLGDQNEVFEKILNMEITYDVPQLRKVSRGVISCIKGLLNLRPEKRISLQNIIDYTFFPPCDANVEHFDELCENNLNDTDTSFIEKLLNNVDHNF